jgi:hypothetical protein
MLKSALISTAILCSLAGSGRAECLSLAPSDPDPTGCRIDDSGGGDTPSLTAWVLPWLGYNVTFSVTDNGNGSYTISNIASNMVGLTVGFSWTPGSSSYSSDPSGVVNFSVTGYTNYNIIVEGIGTIYTDPTTITGSYSIATGEYSIIVN